MKFLSLTTHLVKKFSKGMFVITIFYLAAFICLFVFDSCKKNEYHGSDQYKAKTKFLSALDINKKTIGAVTFTNQGANTSFNSPADGKIASSRTVSVINEQLSGNDAIYLNFPPETGLDVRNLTYSANSIQALSDLVSSSNAVIQYEPNSENSNNQINVPVVAITNSLNPLIEEAKQYLNTKGLTNSDIQDMLVEENGKPEDLVLFVASLTQIENNQQVARNYSNPFINSANAKIDANDYIRFAIVAIGLDVVYSLGTSNLSTWSKPLMKKAFGTIAKRMLGPIGVAIALVSFGSCLAEAHYSN